jgi:transcriptional regulator with XRE-family HTH domain
MERRSGPPWKEVLAILRVIRGWKPTQLGAAAGLKPRAVLDYERPGDRTLERETLDQLAGLMGYPASVVERVASFVEGAWAALDTPEASTKEKARQARIFRIASAAGRWFEDLARRGLTQFLAATDPREAPAEAPDGGAAGRAAFGERTGDPAEAASATRLLGQALTILRIVGQMTQTELDAASGVPRDSISAYERGRFIPRADALRRLVEALGFSAPVLERTLTLIETVQAAGKGAPAAEEGDAAVELIDRLAGEEGRAVEDFARRLLERLALIGRVLASRKRAPALWARLADLPEEEQRRRVEREPELQTSGLCELLCEASVSAAGDSPARALHLADLAVRIAERVVGPPGWCSRLQGYARFHLANAIRVPGELKGADAAFSSAIELWEAGAPDDPGLLNEARVLQMQSSLRREQRRLPEALALLDRALAVDRWGSTTSLLIGKAKAVEECGDFEAAIALLRQAASRPDAHRDTQLMFWVRKNLAVNLCQLGRHAEAELLLPEVRSRAAALGKKTELLRVGWLEGKVAAGLGRHEEALSILERVRRDLLRRAMAYDGALVTLELAEIHASLGHTAQVRTLASESVLVFENQEVHREARAALAYVRAAGEMDMLSLEVIRGVIAYLYRARHDPQLRFEAPT